MTAATDDLIDRLVREARPVSRHAVALRIATGLGVGLLVAAAAMLLLLGPRADLAGAATTGSFWLKLAYTLGLALAGLLAVARLARPGEAARGAVVLGAVILAAGAALGAIELVSSPPAARPALVLGATAERCPWLILGLALPILAGAAWSLRGLAPTRLGSAGLAAGLAAGGFSAAVYSLHCPEGAMPFMAIWYTAGIAAAGLTGALVSRWALRW